MLDFDIFNPTDTNKILEKDGKFDKDNMNIVYSKVNADELSLESVNTRLVNMNLHKKYLLVDGDFQESLPKFLEQNPGFLISLLCIDVDLDKPTYYGLKYL